MENSADSCRPGAVGDFRKDTCSTAPDHRISDPQNSVRQILGGGVVADILLWRRWHVSLGVIIVATVAWLIFEWSGLSFLSILSDVFLILVIVMFLRANYIAFRDNQLETIPELEVSEEMVNNAAASFRVKINYVLLLAHDITLGKDFRVFLKVVICLWILSIVGSYISLFTLAYIGTILSVVVPPLYDRYDEDVNRYCGIIGSKFSKQYKIVDEKIKGRISGSSVKEKDS